MTEISGRKKKCGEEEKNKKATVSAQNFVLIPSSMRQLLY